MAVQILIGAFYAPHAGHTLRARLAFYTALHKAWLQLTAQHPAACRILAGDGNLPELRFMASGQADPSCMLTRYFCDNFLSTLLCANAHAGPPAATHKDDAFLDMILHSPNLQLDSFHILSQRISGCDHSMPVACFVWNHSVPGRPLEWIPHWEVKQCAFDKAM